MLPLTYSHILAVYFSATDNEIIHGERWYIAAHDAAQAISQRYSLPLQTVVGVIAALSPNNRWERNLIDADNLCRLYALGGHDDANKLKVSTYGANKTKALSILGGADPLSVLGGLKVRAFYGCIMGDRDAVCVDGHAYAIWQGQYIPTTKTPKISPKLYAAIAADYKQAAQTINGIISTSYSAAQLQAITWTAWHRLIKQTNIPGD